MKTRFTVLVLIFPILTAASVAQITNRWEIFSRLNFLFNKGERLETITSADGRYFIASGIADSGRHVFVAISNDSGKTWIQVLADTLPEKNIKAYRSVARPAPHLLLATVNEKISEQWYFRVKRSTDEGKTWNNVLPADSAWFPDTLTGTMPTLLDMYDSTYGVVYLGDQTHPFLPDTKMLFRTSDGGLTWRIVAIPYPTHIPWSLQNPRPHCIVYTNNGRVFRSIDTGTTWEQIILPPGYNSINFTDDLHGWTAGGMLNASNGMDQDHIYRTLDGGHSWHIMHDTLYDASRGLYKVDFANDNNGIAVAFDGKTLRTTDGGSTWQHDYRPWWISDTTAFRFLEYPVPSCAYALTGQFVAFCRGLHSIIPPTPRVVKSQILGNYQIQWSPIEGASAYRLQMVHYSGKELQPHISFDVNPILFDSGEITDTACNIGSVLQYQTLYAVRVRSVNSDGGSDWSLPLRFFLIQPASTQNELSAPNIAAFAVFPNPAHDRITALFDRERRPITSETTLSVYDSFGRKVLEKKVGNDARAVDIPITSFSTGIYTIQVTVDRVVKNARVIVFR